VTHGKIGYKTFEHLCDLQCLVARTHTWEDDRALHLAQDQVDWPWCLTQEQRDDWEALYARLDPTPTPPCEGEGT